MRRNAIKKNAVRKCKVTRGRSGRPAMRSIVGAFVDLVESRMRGLNHFLSRVIHSRDELDVIASQEHLSHFLMIRSSSY